METVFGIGTHTYVCVNLEREMLSAFINVFMAQLGFQYNHTDWHVAFMSALPYLHQAYTLEKINCGRGHYGMVVLFMECTVCSSCEALFI